MPPLSVTLPPAVLPLQRQETPDQGLPLADTPQLAPATTFASTQPVPAANGGATVALGARNAPAGLPMASAQPGSPASPVSTFVIGAATGGVPGGSRSLPATPAQPRSGPAALRLPNAGTGGLLDRRQDERSTLLRILLLVAGCLALSGLSVRWLRGS